MSCESKLIDFYIVDTTEDPIFGLSASQELGIAKIVLNISGKPNDTSHFTKMHPKLFQSLNYLEAPYHVQIDSTVTPIVSPQGINLQQYETD